MDLPAISIQFVVAMLKTRRVFPRWSAIVQFQSVNGLRNMPDKLEIADDCVCRERSSAKVDILLKRSQIHSKNPLEKMPITRACAILEGFEAFVAWLSRLSSLHCKLSIEGVHSGKPGLS